MHWGGVETHWDTLGYRGVALRCIGVALEQIRVTQGRTGMALGYTGIQWDDTKMN